MHLQKLVYIAHGWNLAIYNEPLTSDAPMAWDYGPVYRDLWIALRRYGKSPVTKKIKIDDFDLASHFGVIDASELGASLSDQLSEAPLSEEQRELVERVFDLYGKFHAFQLSALTHVKGTPWHDVYKKKGQKYSVIPNELIRDHFTNLAKQREGTE